MKHTKIKNNKKNDGMTLIEMVVALGLAGIIFIFSSQFMTNYAKISMESKAKSQAKELARNVIKIIHRDLARRDPKALLAQQVILNENTNTLTINRYDAKEVEYSPSCVAAPSPNVPSTFQILRRCNKCPNGRIHALTRKSVELGENDKIRIFPPRLISSKDANAQTDPIGVSVCYKSIDGGDEIVTIVDVAYRTFSEEGSLKGSALKRVSARKIFSRQRLNTKINYRKKDE